MERGASTSTTGTTPPATIEPPMAVLVIACNREDYVRRTLDSVLRSVGHIYRGEGKGVTGCGCPVRHRPSAGLFPIIVSQDCGHLPTANAISSYGNRITHIKVSSQC